MSSVIRSKRVLHPCGETRSLVVEEKSTITHCRFASGICSSLDGKILMLHCRHIHPVVPWRYAYLLRQLIDAVYSASHIAACNDESLFHSGQRIAHHCHNIFLNLALQLFLVDLLCLHHLLDVRAFKTTDYYTATYAVGRGIEQLCLIAAHPLEILLQVADGNVDALLVAIRDNKADGL